MLPAPHAGLTAAPVLTLLLQLRVGLCYWDAAALPALLRLTPLLLQTLQQKQAHQHQLL
jgi:hypothetical protein